MSLSLLDKFLFLSVIFGWVYLIFILIGILILCFFKHKYLRLLGAILTIIPIVCCLVTYVMVLSKATVY